MPLPLTTTTNIPPPSSSRLPLRVWPARVELDVGRSHFFYLARPAPDASRTLPRAQQRYAPHQPPRPSRPQEPPQTPSLPHPTALACPLRRERCSDNVVAMATRRPRQCSVVDVCAVDVGDLPRRFSHVSCMTNMCVSGGGAHADASADWQWSPGVDFPRLTRGA
ncbi:hypothetical protein K523DRAFT_358833 [Schizophyllum commune Tattone D]|nr:hypothetical protein K523DRAFT_358833 [Schizophyllum commune Tattone D]